MDFWCHASALFALGWARACNSDLIKRSMLGTLRQQLCARPGAHSGFTEHTESETPWRAASALASALSLGGARTPFARVGSMRAGATHCPPSSSPSSSRSPSPYLPSAMAWPHPRPHPTLVAHSLTFTSTPALAPARSPSPYSTARADVGCWARVWARLVRSATLRSEGSWLAAELLRAGL